MIYKSYIGLFILLFICSCNKNKQLEYALQTAQKNRIELDAVLRYYKNDSLKLHAAQFLIKNMPYHFSQEEYFISPSGKKSRPNKIYFNSEKHVKTHCDSLLKSYHKIEKQKVYDISTLDSSFLVNNIELAFEVWQKPWGKNISFEDFCRYILPYRAQTEMVSNLRKEIMERFVPILDSANVKTPLEACIVLNEHLKSIMKYGNTGLPFYPSIEETYRTGISQCEGLCNLGTYIMRACGIPVAVEQTTWTKMDLTHSWCAVLDSGKFYSFGPGEDQPDAHARLFTEIRYLRPAKVYRSRFDIDLSTMDKNDDGYITHLKSPLKYDVTNEYPNKSIQIQVSLDKKNIKKDKSDQIYLRVYNHYEWHPIAIGYRKDSICYFENVVGDNIFMVADSPEGTELRNITVPFYVDNDGFIHKFIPHKKHRQTFTLNKYENKSGQEHTLQYWDTDNEKFVPLEYISETDTTQTYNQIPENALLWFTIPERIVNQRIFFIENDSMKIY